MQQSACFLKKVHWPLQLKAQLARWQVLYTTRTKAFFFCFDLAQGHFQPSSEKVGISISLWTAPFIGDKTRTVKIAFRGRPHAAALQLDTGSTKNRTSDSQQKKVGRSHKGKSFPWTGRYICS